MPMRAQGWRCQDKASLFAGEPDALSSERNTTPSDSESSLLGQEPGRVRPSVTAARQLNGVVHTGSRGGLAYASPTVKLRSVATLLGVSLEVPDHTRSLATASALRSLPH